MSNNLTPVNRNAPCPVCGKPDWCFWKPSQNGVLLYCARKADESVSSGGNVYIRVNTASNGMSVYETETQMRAAREKFIEEKRRENPDWKPRNNFFKPKPKAAPVVPAMPTYQVVDDVPVAPPNVLHEVYSYLLSLLILEPMHEQRLRKEWTIAGFEEDKVFETLTNLYPIRSLPPPDKERFESGLFLKNALRKEIFSKMAEQFGDQLKGVPGFYLNQFGNWDMYWLSGIIFPAYDTEGHIIRLRIKDEHPLVEGSFDGKDGAFFFRDGGWWFTPDKEVPDGNGGTKTIADYDSKELVYHHKKKVRKIVLTESGLPKGKVSGKYKNLTSWVDQKNDDGIVTNKLKYGCKSGSNCSVYQKEGDDYSWAMIIEGEKKGMIANFFKNIPCSTIPGVSTFSKLFEKQEGLDYSILEYLRQRGCRNLILCYDADRSEKEQVQRELNRFIEKLIAEGYHKYFRIYISEWNMDYGKGADDTLLRHGSFQMRPLEIR